MRNFKMRSPTIAAPVEILQGKAALQTPDHDKYPICPVALPAQ